MDDTHSSIDLDGLDPLKLCYRPDIETASHRSYFCTVGTCHEVIRGPDFEGAANILRHVYTCHSDQAIPVGSCPFCLEWNHTGGSEDRESLLRHVYSYHSTITMNLDAQALVDDMARDNFFFDYSIERAVQRRRQDASRVIQNFDEAFRLRSVASTASARHNVNHNQDHNDTQPLYPKEIPTHPLKIDGFVKDIGDEIPASTSPSECLQVSDAIPDLLEAFAVKLGKRWGTEGDIQLALSLRPRWRTRAGGFQSDQVCKMMLVKSMARMKTQGQSGWASSRKTTAPEECPSLLQLLNRNKTWSVGGNFQQKGAGSLPLEVHDADRAKRRRKGSTSQPVQTTNGQEKQRTGRGTRKLDTGQDTSDGPDDDVYHDKGKNSQHVGERETFFACPFWKSDTDKHYACFRFRLQRLGDVKQHLYRKHYAEFPCLRCKDPFSTWKGLNSHMKENRCSQKQSKQLEYVTRDQKEQLGRRSKHGNKTAEAWFEVWHILFADKPRPASPYIDHKVLKCSCGLKAYCEENAAATLAQVQWSEPVTAVTSELERYMNRMIQMTVSALVANWDDGSPCPLHATPDNLSPSQGPAALRKDCIDSCEMIDDMHSSTSWNTLSESGQPSTSSAMQSDQTSGESCWAPSLSGACQGETDMDQRSHVSESLDVYFDFEAYDKIKEDC